MTSLSPNWNAGGKSWHEAAREGRLEMSALPTVEERLAIVEKEVAELKRAVFQETPKPNWLKAVLGSFKDDPDFKEQLV